MLLFSVENLSAQNNPTPSVTPVAMDSSGKLIEFLSAKTYNVKKQIVLIT